MLSNLLTEVCYGKTVCNSTEEMLASIEECNKTEIDREFVIGSADVISLYPSIEIDHAVQVVCEEFTKKEITMEGVDYEELGLYLALNREEESLEAIGLGRVCPKRLNTVGRRPEITASGIEPSKLKRFTPWRRAEIEPNEEQKVVMMELALKIGLTVVMKNHTYKFNNEIKRQLRGGPIGMDLTGTVAKIYMKWWDDQLLRKLEDIGCHTTIFNGTRRNPKELYERYIDDINIGLKAVEEGARYIDGRKVVTEEGLAEDRGIPIDRRTFEFLKTVGNDIHPSIQLEVDVPSNHTDGKLPILDLKVWIEEIQTDEGVKRKIVHEHYIKEIANKHVIHEKAAMSYRDKRRILTQMLLRVMLNNSTYLTRERKKEKVEFFLRRMQASGYTQKFRYEVLKSAINAHEKLKDNEGRTIYRSKDNNTPQRRAKQRRAKKEWYKKGGHESVLFVQATPRSELIQLIAEEISLHNVNIKVVERAGTKVKRILQQNDPFEKKKCDEGKCFVCDTTGKGTADNRE